MREIAGWSLLGAGALLAVVLDDPAPALLPAIAGVLLVPRRSWKPARSRRRTRVDRVAFVLFVVGLALTLLIPDGLVRWVVLAVLCAAYLASLRLLDPDR
jgi:hypothetical protein